MADWFDFGNRVSCSIYHMFGDSKILARWSTTRIKNRIYTSRISNWCDLLLHSWGISISGNLCINKTTFFFYLKKLYNRLCYSKKYK